MTLDGRRTEAGKRRKAIEKALRAALTEWRAGADGNVLLGRIEQEFFATRSQEAAE